MVFGVGKDLKTEHKNCYSLKKGINATVKFYLKDTAKSKKTSHRWRENICKEYSQQKFHIKYMKYSHNNNKKGGKGLITYTCHQRKTKKYQ